MSITAMKQALEALKCIESPLYVREINKVGEAITALRQAIEQAEQKVGPTQSPYYMLNPKADQRPIEQAEKAEPVAWMDKKRAQQLIKGHGVTTTLTKHPALSDDVPIYTHPAREWVGLTDEERNKLWREVIGWGDPSHDDEDLMKAIEAKLKEKNT